MLGSGEAAFRVLVSENDFQNALPICIERLCTAYEEFQAERSTEDDC